MRKLPAAPSANVTLVDVRSLFDAGEALARAHGRDKITLDYANLAQVLERARIAPSLNFPPATLSLAFVAVDPASEPQRRFLSMLSRSFEPDVSDFRDVFVSNPPGLHYSENKEKPISSLSSRIAYALGLLAHREAKNVLLVSHAFELRGPLLDLTARGGRVALTYFRSLLDPRWERSGLLRSDSPIAFYDLEPHGQSLVGLPLSPDSATTIASGSGLSRL